MTITLATGDWNNCRALATQLAQSHGSFSSTSVIAVCAGNAEVRRIAVGPTNITELATIATGDWNVCRAKEAEINACPALGTTVQGTFTCAGNAEVIAQFVTPDANESAITVPTGDWNRCRALATKLAETRGSIADTKIVAVCGGNATIRRFSVRSVPSGDRNSPKTSALPAHVKVPVTTTGAGGGVGALRLQTSSALTWSLVTLSSVYGFPVARSRHCTRNVPSSLRVIERMSETMSLSAEAASSACGPVHATLNGARQPTTKATSEMFFQAMVANVGAREMLRRGDRTHAVTNRVITVTRLFRPRLGAMPFARR